MSEYPISFYLKIMQNKIPSLHTLAKCAAHAYGYDTLFAWPGVYEGTSDGTWSQKAYDNLTTGLVAFGVSGRLRLQHF